MVYCHQLMWCMLLFLKRIKNAVGSLSSRHRIKNMGEFAHELNACAAYILSSNMAPGEK